MSDNIEVMESVDGSRPIILQSPSCFKKHNSEAKRRWRLLKNVTVATTRRTSLTPKEEEFLKRTSKPDTTATSSCGDEKRELFRESLLNGKAKLTPAEHTFLSSLVESDHVTEEELENVGKVLEKDPIFQHDTTTKQEKKREKKESSNRMASFREEVWTEYKSLRHLDEVVEEESKASPPSQSSSSVGFFSNIFGRGKEKTEDAVKEDVDISKSIQESPYSILAACGKDPDCQPNVLSPPMMDALREFMPFAVSEDNFWLKFSMTRDGASMRALLKEVRSSARTVIAVETMDGDVFGSFTSSPWRPHGKSFYGNGESFLWKVNQNRYLECNTVNEQIELEKDISVFKWSGKNYNIQALVNPDADLVLGGGGDEKTDPFDDQGKGSGLMINSNLERGVSDDCLTFDSPSLNDSNIDSLFEIANIEVWTLTPVDSLAEAQQLELGRQFIFDHGNFAL